jgi:hypothetical protein
MRLWSTLLDIEPEKGERAGANRCKQAKQEQRPSSEAEYEKALGQELPPKSSWCRPFDEKILDRIFRPHLKLAKR